jgi:hypothetical protein
LKGFKEIGRATLETDKSVGCIKSLASLICYSGEMLKVDFADFSLMVLPGLSDAHPYKTNVPFLKCKISLI